MVYGIGRNISNDILNKHNIDLLKKTRDLTDEEQKILSDEIKEMIVENDLRREVGNHIKRLKEIKCYR
jgi:small subunit ribosomal protein S13